MSRTVEASLVWLGSNVPAGKLSLTVGEDSRPDVYTFQLAVVELLGLDQADRESIRVTFNGKPLTALRFVNDESDAHRDARFEQVAQTWRELYACKSPVTLLLTRFLKASVAASARIQDMLFAQMRSRLHIGGRGYRYCNDN